MSQENLPNKAQTTEIVDKWLDQIKKSYGEKRQKEFEQEKGYLKDYLEILYKQINVNHYSICTITEPLFVGGSGVVFKGVHRNIPSQELVLKFNRPLAPELLPVIDGKPTSMVETERKILPLFNHANIIQALDIGYFDNPTDEFRPLSFIVMPFIQGNVTLKKYAVSLALSDQTVVSPEAIDDSMRKLIQAIHQWISALIYAHQKDFIYLDVKPDNALLDREGHLFLIDFGSAQKVNPESNESFEVFVTRYYADPRLKEKFLDKSSSNRVRCGVKGKELTKDLDYYAIGKSILELLSLISESHKNDFPQRPLFRSMHFLATRLLNGSNESKRSQTGLVDQDILTETFPGLQAYDYKTICYDNLSDVLVDLEKELGSWNPDDKIPELGNYAKNVVRVVPNLNTVITPRLRKLLEHPLFARLKMINQLGLVSLVYPTADHSRYDHVLGAYTYTANYVNALFHDSQNPIFRNVVDEQYLKGVLIAALVHDLGQFPLAHDLGEVVPKIFGHSSISIELLSNPKRDRDGRTIAEIIEGKDDWNVTLNCLRKILRAHSGRQLVDSETRDFKADMLSALIDGPIDADKADYIVRDSAQCRVPYGSQLDIERLLRVITAVPIPEHLRSKHKVTIGVYEKGRASADAFSLARYLLYSSVYWHHTSRITKAMLQYATVLLLPDEVFTTSGDDEIKRIRAKLISFLMTLSPPFENSISHFEVTKKIATTKENIEGKKLSSDVLKILEADKPQTAQIGQWYPGISWTDWLMLEWIKNLSDDPRGIALIDMIQKRQLYKRVLTIPRNEHNKKLINTLDSLSWQKKLELSEKIQTNIKLLIEKKAPEIETKSLSCPDDVEKVFTNSLAILVDIPNVERINAERPLIYMPELERKTYYHPSTLPTEADSLNRAQDNLLESVSPVRILCHPDLRQWLHYCVNQSKLLEIIDEVLEEP